MTFIYSGLFVINLEFMILCFFVSMIYWRVFFVRNLDTEFYYALSASNCLLENQVSFLKLSIFYSLMIKSGSDITVVFFI